MSDPVIAPTGRTYQREALEQWLSNHITYPDSDLSGSLPAYRDQSTRDRNDDPSSDDPAWLRDPVTFERFADPYVASDGRTYDRATLRSLFQQARGRSPFTRQPLERIAYRNEALASELARRNATDSVVDAPRRIEWRAPIPDSDAETMPGAGTLVGGLLGGHMLGVGLGHLGIFVAGPLLGGVGYLAGLPAGFAAASAIARAVSGCRQRRNARGDAIPEM